MTNIVNHVIELEAFLGSRAVRVLRQQVAEETPEKGIILMEQFTITLPDYLYCPSDSVKNVRIIIKIFAEKLFH